MKRVVFVVMGVCGSGKTTFGKALADTLGVSFWDGDDFHPPTNVQKMSAGLPLSDEDRLPWLQVLADKVADQSNAGQGGVIACSALKKHYRKLLGGNGSRVVFLYLKGTSDVLNKRLSNRSGHFMPGALLQSQLDALEEPGADESALTLNIECSVEQLVKQVGEEMMK